MNKTIARLCALLACTVLVGILGGCVTVNFTGTGVEQISGRGELQRLEFPVGSYDSLVLSANVNLVYSATAREVVEIDIYENMVEYLEVDVEAGTLTVRSTKEFTTTGNKPVTVMVYNPGLRNIDIRGGVSMTGDAITGDFFRINVSGACDVEQRLEVGSFEAILAGAGSMTLNGTANQATIEISGAGTVDAFGLEVKNLDISLSGVGSAQVHCTEVLNASTSGVGSIEYRGNPGQTNTNASGVGSIQSVS